MTRIKLCGLKRPCDIDYVNELLPDYIGFVFVKGRKRYISEEDALSLSRQLERRITPVGVFIDESIENICNICNKGIIRAVQLHGKEDEEYIKTLKSKCGCEIIKAFQIKSADDIFIAEKSVADTVLLDSGTGSGLTFDRSLLVGMKRKFFLAGGLSIENVPDIIKKIHPYGVDVSSAIETDGYKDKEKMIAFVNAVRKADRNDK